MARPTCCRRVAGSPGATLFRPDAGPACGASAIVVALDEFEALRLADREGLHHEDAAARMGVSRPTFGRILESARRKVADALTEGRALRIEGGTVCRSARREPRTCTRWAKSSLRECENP
ncbi:MAG: DUF134 domain-containing protein [Candidatus Bipolaricaulota bacterium]